MLYPVGGGQSQGTFQWNSLLSMINNWYGGRGKTNKMKAMPHVWFLSKWGNVPWMKIWKLRGWGRGGCWYEWYMHWDPPIFETSSTYFPRVSYLYLHFYVSPISFVIYIIGNFYSKTNRSFVFIFILYCPCTSFI